MDERNAIDYRALKARGMMRQRDGDVFAVRLGVTGGHVSADQLRVTADAAARYGAGRVHLTTRQGIEIPDVPLAHLESLEGALAAAGIPLGRSGPRVRGIVACPADVCQHGLADTQRLARTLEAAIGGRAGLPHKFKIAVTGCPNGCAKPVENDFGVMATTGGFRAFVGGRMGKKPRLADPLPFKLADESILIRVIHASLDWYSANANGRERFGATIDRVGLAALIAYLQPCVG